MPKIQEREVDMQTFSELKRDSAVINFAECKDSIESAQTIAIYKQFANRRHDLQIYRVTSKEITGCVYLLVKRTKLDEQKYFLKVDKYVVIDGASLQDVLNDKNTINYSITDSEETFKEAVRIMRRSVQYVPYSYNTYPETVKVIQIQDQIAYIVLLVENVNTNLLKKV